MEIDPCIYVKEIITDDKGVKKTQFQTVALYVDDFIIAASTKNLITDLEGVFESRFKMKKQHQTNQILGMGIHYDQDCNIIYITQQKYIEESVKTFIKNSISDFRTQIDDRAQYSRAQFLQVTTFPYRKLIGTLLWKSNGTRSNIGFLNSTWRYCIRYAQQHFN
jgi:Reverse transcriptase (RNA-dependent DNA polymerase)